MCNRACKGLDWTNVTGLFGKGTQQQYAQYLHALSGQDIEKAQRKRLGIVKNIEPEKRFQICLRCKREMPVRAEFCMICCEPLSQNKVKILEDGMKAIVSDEIRVMVEELFFENPDKFDLIRSKMQAHK